MKITKLMLSALVAAAALVACNKENHTPEATGVKSVTLSLENAIMTTKSVTDTKIENNTKVQVNNLKIFLLDQHDNVYGASQIAQDGTVSTAPMYFEFNAENKIPAEINFHYVDPAVTKVVAYANIGNVAWADVSEVLDIKDEQDPKDLTLYGADTQLTGGTQKTHANGDVTLLYDAEITLCPRISRFELDGFRIVFTEGKAPDYASITISKIAFQNYYQTTNAATGVEEDTIVSHIADLSNEFSVFDWFNNTTTNAWYWDTVAKTLTPTAPAAAAGPYAYHFFSCDKMPVLMIDLIADGRPAYLYTKSFNKVTVENGTRVTTPITSIEEGKVYRMEAASTVGGSDDGYVEIPEEVIDPANHCIDITVSVQDWIVTLVQPVF